ncbi:hypothetical protein CBS101457_006754 [Exobasidium rhododendri]|nr:hypothetical protein CBS101457_006754 [Exobasidium rhododendri]
MIQPGFAPIGSGTYSNSMSYGGINNQSLQSQNGGAHQEGNGGQNGSQQQQSESGQLSQQSQQPEYTLAGVLHFLQTEWRRYERDRNEWEIERAEMRARVALLEGERRSVENLKTDLMRRVKMLEFALRQERSKYLASGTSAATPHTGSVAPAKNPALQNLEKASTSSGRSSPALHDTISEPAHQRSISTMSTATFNSNKGTMNGYTMGGPASTLSTTGAMLSRQYTNTKDPKARAKSREYLKQCLQEISYLTSASSLNPLPDRAASGVVGGAIGPARPKKILSDNVPSAFGSEAPSAMTSGAMRRQRSLEVGKSAGSKSVSTGTRGLQLFEEPLVERDEEGTSLHGEGDHEAVPLESQMGIIGDETVQERNEEGLALDRDSLAIDNRDSNHSMHSQSSIDSDPLSAGSSQTEQSSHNSIVDDLRARESLEDDDEKQHVTAIFRPSGGNMPDNDDWAKLKSVGMREREKRERDRSLGEKDVDNMKDEHAQLHSSSESLNQLMHANSDQGFKGEEDDLVNLTMNNEGVDDESSQSAAESAAAAAASEGQMWKSKRVLRSHLDAVRAVVFDHFDLSLYSASDDNTIKFWRIDPAMLKQTIDKLGVGRNSTDSDPILTLRGHSAAVTCLAISTSKRRLYSGSVDTSILVWRLVDGDKTEAYPPYDQTMELTRLIGHTQAIWDVCLLPTKMDGEGLLASASADGTVKFWSVVDGNDQNKLLLSFDYFGIDPTEEKEREKEDLLREKGSLPVPTSIAACMSDLRRCAVSFSNSIVKLFEVETGKEVMQIASDEHYDGTEASQINKVLSHPTLPILITGHENNYIKFFDSNTGICTLSMIAHLDSVTCLDIDSSGLTLASGGHDCSVRYWDYDNEKNTAVCVQEVTAHRKKSLSMEGVLQVKYHPAAPWFCSAGADGVIRIYG